MAVKSKFYVATTAGWVEANFGGTGSGSFYGVSSGSSNARTVTLSNDDGNFELVTGATVNVKFTYASSSGSMTLNVNSTGAKTIKRNGGDATEWKAGAIVNLVYDGSEWIMSSGSYLPLSGGALTGDLVLSGSDTSSSLNSKSKLIFSNGSTEYAALSATSTAFVVNPSSTSTENQFVYYFSSGQLVVPGSIKENGTDLSSKYQVKGNYAGSSSAGGAASYVAWSAASDNVARRIPFAYNSTTETTNDRIRMCYDDDFKYNPSSNTLFVNSINSNTNQTMTIKSASTFYTDRGSACSFIWKLNGVQHARFDTAGHFRPEYTQTYDIGASEYYWNNIYGTTIYENGTSLASKYATIGSKSYLTPQHSISAGDNNTHYYKLITIKPTSTAYLDLYYEFDVVARANKYAKIRIYVITNNDNRYISSVYVNSDGALGIDNFKAYKFTDTTNKIDRVEIWCKVTSWDTLEFYPKTSDLPSGISFTWDKTKGTAFPTDATSTITIEKKSWIGNAATATKATQDGAGNTITTTYALKTHTQPGTTITGPTGSVKDEGPFLLANDGDGAATSWIEKSDLLSGYATQTWVKNACALKSDITSLFKFKGSLSSIDELPTSVEQGAVYNISSAFTANSSFPNDNGKSFPAGTNVVYVAGSSSNYWEVLGGTYSTATTSTDGLMSSADKTKLDDIHGSYVSQSELSEYATQTWVEGKGYATQNWVTGRGYTTNKGTVTQVNVGTTTYSPTAAGVISLPAYPTIPTSLKNPNSLGIKVNSESTAFVTYDGSAAKTITIKPSTTDGAFTISDGSTTKTIQLTGKFTDTVYTLPSQYSNTITSDYVVKLSQINAPTTAGGSTYGLGTSGQILKTNGDTIYWGSLTASDIPVLGASKITSGTFEIGRIPTGTSSTTVALGNHTHNYAGSSSAGGAATSAVKSDALTYVTSNPSSNNSTGLKVVVMSSVPTTFRSGYLYIITG